MPAFVLRLLPTIVMTVICNCNFFFSEGDNDFKLAEFLAGTPETFEPHYGENNILYRSYLLWTPLNVLSLE